MNSNAHKINASKKPYSAAQMRKIATDFTTASACHTAPGTSILHAYNNAAKVRKLCRICGCNGTHSLHEPIPFFIHANPADVLRWPKTMGAMIADIGGQEYGPITTDQELPQLICTICVTYLMHAIEFREQAINTLRNLKTALRLAGIANSKSNGGADNNDDDATKFATAKQSAPRFSEPLPQPSLKSSAAQRMHADMRHFFASDLACPPVTGSEETTTSSTPTPTSSDSDTNTNGGGGGLVYPNQPRKARPSLAAQVAGVPLPNATITSACAFASQRQFSEALVDFFTHTETHFVEAESAVVGEAVAETERRRQQLAADARKPEPLKEHKCYACKRMFMVRTSFDAHQKECVVARLLQFTVNCNRMVQMRRDENMLELEFIRRMVFEVKSLVKLLALAQRGWAGGGVGDGKEAAAPAKAKSQLQQQRSEPIPWPTKLPVVPTRMLPPALREASGSPDEVDAGQVIGAAAAMGLPQPPGISCQSECSTDSNSFVDGCSRPETRSSRSSSSMDGHNVVVAALVDALPQRQPPLQFAARCSECCQPFESIVEFELHNRMLHNGGTFSGATSAAVSTGDEEAKDIGQPLAKRQAATMDLLQLLRDNPPTPFVYGAK